VKASRSASSIFMASPCSISSKAIASALDLAPTLSNAVEQILNHPIDVLELKEG
jgi:hypothetical protein